MTTAIWTEIYNIVSNAVFAGSPADFTYGEFFCEGFSFLCCAFLVCLPVIIIWRIIRRLI